MTVENNKKKKRNSTGKNYIYNLIYQIFLLIVPIAVTPYVSRILGSDGSGKYSFAYSIITYFTLFGALGFNTYAQREIAKHQDDKHKQSVIFWEIFIARLFPVVITLVVYFSMVSSNLFGRDTHKLMIILSINLVAIIFDITFFFQANEEFGIIVFTNLVIKLIGISCIFIFVKDSNDLWIYTLIQSLIVFCSFLVLWMNLPHKITKIEKKELHIFKHFAPTLLLFLPTIATSVYTSLDKTLIGLLIDGTTTNSNGIIVNISDVENGNYEYAEKLVKMSMTFLTAFGIVMIPRNTKLYAEGNMEDVKRNVYSTCKFVFALGIPIMFGIIAVSDNAIPWYLGNDYIKAPQIMKILSPLVIIIGISNVIGLQFMIPTGKDKKFTIAIVMGACINLILNLILIPRMLSYGASLATVVAELLVTSLMLYFVRKEIKLSNIIKECWKYIMYGIIMFIPVYFLGQKLSSSIGNSIIIVLTGLSIYIVELIIFKDSTVIILYNKIKNIIVRLRDKRGK